jgi:hypothetical protein
VTLPTSKAEAVRTGSRFFVTAAPCPRGHTGPRYTRGGRCVDCTKQDNAKRLGHAFISGRVRGVVCPGRDAAIAAGETTYAGAPCKFGHTERFTASANCVECNKAALERDAEARRWSRRLRLYGIDRAGYDALHKSQGGKCPICVEPLPAIDRTHIDHCHTTGRVRGLLCGPCNQAIGLLKECPDRMGRAAAYVRD